MIFEKALSHQIQDQKTLFSSSFFEECEKEFGNEIFTKWLSKLDVASYSESEVILSAPSKFVRDWVIREFLEVKGSNLLTLAKKCQSQIKKLSIVFSPKAEEESIKDISFKVNSSENKIVNLSKHDNVFAFGTELNPRYTFKNFVSSKYNKLALSMAKIAAKIEGQINLFEEAIPLFIHGGVGMGKTHLAQAIAWEIQEKDKSKKVVYLSAEKFMYHFVQSVRNNDVMDFKQKMRSIDVLIVDDVQFIAGKESTQQEFMNSFNHLVEENKQVVLVCDRCPSDLENVDEKLKSRITGGMIVNFKNADYQSAKF
ncbi:MAG: AAA family ATPase [Pelagibacterales bacterium]|nr:AAA family ATPase [Pelagibacterales bacterium]